MPITSFSLKKQHDSSQKLISYVAISITLVNWLLILDSLEQAIIVTWFPASLLFLTQILIRLCRFFGILFANEDHLLTFEKMQKVAVDNCYCNGSTLVFVSCVLLVAIMEWDTLYGFITSNNSLLPLLLASVTIILMSRVINLDDCPSWQSHTLACMNSLDYGSGMAHSYYFGYLKIILPAKGDSTPSLTERIERYMDRNGLTDSSFPAKKLVILAPRSGYSYPILSDVHLKKYQKIIEPCSELDDNVRDRAGTRNRVYRQVVYRIRYNHPISTGNDDFLYVVAEGATPLHTFHEAYSSNSVDAVHLKKFEGDVTSMFIDTLRELINNDPECRNLAEVIAYDDEKEDLSQVLKDWLLDQRLS